MSADDRNMGSYHPCEECKVRKKRCIASGAYGACERCQKKRRHCSGMDVKDGRLTNSTSGVQPNRSLYTLVSPPRVLRSSLLKKLIRHGATEKDLKTIRSQGYITVPKWLATPGSSPPAPSLSIPTVMLPISLYTLPAMHFLGFTPTSATSHLHSLMTELSHMHDRNITVPPDFLINYFTKARLNEKITAQHLDNRAICEAAGFRPDVYGTLLKPEHKNALEMAPMMIDWLVDIVVMNARALLKMSTTVKNNLKKMSRARNVVHGHWTVEQIYEEVVKGKCMVRRIIVARLLDRRIRIFRIQDVGRRGKKEEVLRKWEDLDKSDGGALVGGYPFFVFNDLSFGEVERAVILYERLLNEICWVEGKIRVEIEVPVPDVASLEDIGMAPEEAERVVDECRRRQLLVSWFEMHKE